jgi:hypothetical protein
LTTNVFRKNEHPKKAITFAISCLSFNTFALSAFPLPGISSYSLCLVPFFVLFANDISPSIRHIIYQSKANFLEIPSSSHPVFFPLFTHRRRKNVPLKLRKRKSLGNGRIY